MGGDVGWGDGMLAFLTNEDLILPDVHKEIDDFRSHNGERKAGKGDRALGGRGKSQKKRPEQRARESKWLVGMRFTPVRVGLLRAGGEDQWRDEIHAWAAQN